MECCYSYSAASCFKTLTAITASPFNFHSKAFSLLLRRRSVHKLSLSSSPFCSISESGNGNYLPNGVGEGVGQGAQNKLLQVVLVSPQIPGNTGCIARSCAASAVGLHLVGPLGFQVDDAKLKRAGLDYWPYVVVKVHDSWTEFRNYFIQQEGEKRLLAFTKRGTSIHSDFSYKRGDWLVFGAETSGLPPEALVDCKSEQLGGGTIRIPMVETYVRCLNLSTHVATKTRQNHVLLLLLLEMKVIRTGLCRHWLGVGLQMSRNEPSGGLFMFVNRKACSFSAHVRLETNDLLI